VHRTAVLLGYHGTVAHADETEAFLTAIRRGRPTPPELVREVRRRFEHIGGSPLRHISEEQARALEARLGVPVRAAARVWHPSAADVVAELAALGVRRVVSLPLAPPWVHVYHAAFEPIVRARGLDFVGAPSWGLAPALVDAFVEAIAEAHARFAAAERAGLGVVLSAHSLPVRVLDAGDPYERDFRALAGAVAEQLAARELAGAELRVAFQSQGADGGPWLGPDLGTTFAELRAAGRRALLVGAVGFVSDHVETLYDLDVAAAARARELGFVRFERAPSLNARPRFIDALEAVARPLCAAR
jgi:ferrochelatase